MSVNKFGERLRSRREKLGISQSKLAELAEASKASIVNWEKLDTPVSGIQWKKFIKLCAALKANPEWMKTGEGPEDISEVAAEAGLDTSGPYPRFRFPSEERLHRTLTSVLEQVLAFCEREGLSLTIKQENAIVLDLLEGELQGEPTTPEKIRRLIKIALA